MEIINVRNCKNLECCEMFPVNRPVLIRKDLKIALKHAVTRPMSLQPQWACQACRGRRRRRPTRARCGSRNRRRRPTHRYNTHPHTTPQRLFPLHSTDTFEGGILTRRHTRCIPVNLYTELRSVTASLAWLQLGSTLSRVFIWRG